MTSELDMITAGVRFSWNNGRAVPSSKRKDIDFRAIIAERLHAVRERLNGGPSLCQTRWGQCDACGQAMQSHRSGFCWLCCCAAQKIHSEKPVVPAVAAEPVMPKSFRETRTMGGHQVIIECFSDTSGCHATVTTKHSARTASGETIFDARRKVLSIDLFRELNW